LESVALQRPHENGVLVDVGGSLCSLASFSFQFQTAW
jgi:hypothetical protein